MQLDLDALRRAVQVVQGRGCPNGKASLNAKVRDGGCEASADHLASGECGGAASGYGILFDAARWVRSWESGLRRAVEVEVQGLRPMHLTPGPVTPVLASDNG